MKQYILTGFKAITLQIYNVLVSGQYLNGLDGKDMDFNVTRSVTVAV